MFRIDYTDKVEEWRDNFLASGKAKNKMLQENPFFRQATELLSVVRRDYKLHGSTHTTVYSISILQGNAATRLITVLLLNL